MSQPQSQTSTPPPWRAYLALARIDRPVGTLLLLWPTLAALWIAADGPPPWLLVAVFALGTFLMRSAGCVINDIADRNIDPRVARTKSRPLAARQVSLTEAKVLFALLCALAGFLLFFLNNFTRILAVSGLAIAIVYPFMKRITYLPQVVLGAAFSWGIVMAFGAIQQTVPPPGWLLFVASIFWIVAYDTMYAMTDRDDDLMVGVKSTAILFGTADRFMVGVMQACTLFCLYLLGSKLEYQGAYFVGLAVAAVLFVKQQQMIKGRDRDQCFRAFANNVWVGFAFFVGVVIELTIQPAILDYFGWLPDADTAP